MKASHTTGGLADFTPCRTVCCQVTSAGGGAAIPLHPRLLGRLISAAVKGAEGVPVTVKMRMGVSEDLLTFKEVCMATAYARADSGRACCFLWQVSAAYCNSTWFLHPISGRDATGGACHPHRPMARAWG